MTTVHTALKKASKALDNLREERQRIVAHVGEIRTERQRVAPAALAGDVAAAARLDQLKLEKVAVLDHSTDVSAAIRQAERDVAAAQEAVTAFDSREVAQRWLEQAGELETAGQAAQAAVQAFIAAIGQIGEITGGLRGSGGMAVSKAHVDLMLKQSIASHLIGAGLADATVPAGARRQITALISGYAATIRAAANRQITSADEMLGESNERVAA